MMTPVMQRRTLAVSFLLLAFLLAGGCARTREAQVERWQNGAYQPVASHDYQIKGRRQGAQTTATATLTLESDDHLRIDLTLAYDPTPELVSGHWKLDGEDGGEGDVRVESLKFLGGQGSGPSVGGRFLLEESNAPRFRVELPSRPVAQSW